MPVSRRTFLGASAGALAHAQSVPPSDRIAIGMLGAGSRSHELLEAIRRIDGAEVAGVCDAYTGRVERAVERTEGRAKAYESYQDILADPAIDAVTIGTPDHWHRQMVLEALDAGKDVYCEKPLTFTVDEGLEITKAAEASGRILQVGSQGISDPGTRMLRDWVQSGKLGQVTMIRASYNRNSPGGAWIYPIPPDASPETIDWKAFLGPAPQREFDLDRFFRWRCYQDYSGGIATDLFVHLCTTIHFVMGVKMPAEAFAMGDLYRWKENREVPDTLNAILRYREGFTANLSSTFNSRADRGSQVQVLGTEGAAKMAGRELVFYPETGYDNNSWIVDAWPTRLREEYYETPAGRAERQGPPTPKDEVVKLGSYAGATVAHMADFCSAVRNRGAPVEDAWAGHYAASCAHLINASVAEGSMQRWDFVRHRQAA